MQLTNAKTNASNHESQFRHMGAKFTLSIGISVLASVLASIRSKLFIHLRGGAMDEAVRGGSVWMYMFVRGRYFVAVESLSAENQRST